MTEGGVPPIEGQFREMRPNEQSKGPEIHVKVPGAARQDLHQEENRAPARSGGWRERLSDLFFGKPEQTTFERAQEAIEKGHRVAEEAKRIGSRLEADIAKSEKRAEDTRARLADNDRGPESVDRRENERDAAARKVAEIRERLVKETPEERDAAIEAELTKLKKKGV